MIKKFNEFIKESIWSDMQDRGTGDVNKKEDGVKVHTCIDEDVFLINPNCDYDGLIKALFNKQYTYMVEISKLEHQPLSIERCWIWYTPYCNILVI